MCIGGASSRRSFQAGCEMAGLDRGGIGDPGRLRNTRTVGTLAPFMHLGDLKPKANRTLDAAWIHDPLSRQGLRTRGCSRVRPGGLCFGHRGL